MNKWIRRSAVGIFVIVLLSGVLAALVSWATPSGPWCKVTGDFVAGLDARDLPKNLKQFTEIPKLYRLDVFAAMTPLARAAVVREAVEEASQAPGLTEAQRELLNRVLPHLKPSTYDVATPRSDASIVALLAMEVEAKDLFTSAAWQQLVSPMHRVQTIPTQVAWLLPSLREALAGVAEAASPELLCNCKEEWQHGWDEGWNCVEGDCSCTWHLLPLCMSWRPGSPSWRTTRTERRLRSGRR